MQGNAIPISIDKKPLAPEVINKVGRPKGSRNVGLLKRMSDAETFASNCIDDPQYLANLKQRAIDGTLSPAAECLLWYYRFGKPVNRVEIHTNGTDLSNYSIQSLADRCKELADAAIVIAEQKEKLLEVGEDLLEDGID